MGILVAAPIGFALHFVCMLLPALVGKTYGNFVVTAGAMRCTGTSWTSSGCSLCRRCTSGGECIGAFVATQAGSGRSGRLLGALVTLYHWIHGLVKGEKAPANPWGSRSLEWTTASPPPYVAPV